MSFLFNCGLMCALISVWGAIQLGFMSLFYHLESVVLIEDCEAHDPKSYDDFIERTKKNYQATALNCLIASIIYALTLLISIVCIWQAMKKDRLRAARLEDDELSCLPPPPKPEVSIKKQEKTGVLASIIGRKKDKNQAAAKLDAKKPTGNIDIKDMEELMEEKKAVGGETSGGEGKKKEKKEKKKKKDKEGKKKKKKDQDT